MKNGPKMPTVNDPIVYKNNMNSNMLCLVVVCIGRFIQL